MEAGEDEPCGIGCGSNPMRFVQLFVQLFQQLVSAMLSLALRALLLLRDDFQIFQMSHVRTCELDMFVSPTML